MEDMFLRTSALIGASAVEKLKKSSVAVFGLGGVGSYAAEALARAGVGKMTLIDPDKISETNINRQLVALHSTVGLYKADVCRDRILDINPNIKVTSLKVFYLPDNDGGIDFTDYDYIVDAVDTVSAKIALAENAEKSGVPIISSLGTGNKLDASAFKVSDIYSTKVCPLARVMRTELKKRGVKSLKVVYSEETPLKTDTGEEKSSGHTAPASISFVPPVAGLIAAGEVIKDLIK